MSVRVVIERLCGSSWLKKPEILHSSMAGAQIKIVNPLKNEQTNKKNNNREGYLCPSRDSQCERGEEKSNGSTEVLKHSQ